jgi:hypothetical protein
MQYTSRLARFPLRDYAYIKNVYFYDLSLLMDDAVSIVKEPPTARRSLLHPSLLHYVYEYIAVRLEWRATRKYLSMRISRRGIIFEET